MSEIRIEVELPASADRVWRAWAQPVYLGQWISGHARVEADVRVGGHFRLELPGERDALVVTGSYLLVDEYARLVMSWREASGDEEAQESELDIRLADAGSPKRTKLILEHRGLDASTVADHEQGWHEMLAVLKEYLTL